MKVEINLDTIERKAIKAFKDYEREGDRVALGEAYAYTELLSSLIGRNYHTLIELLSTRADQELQKGE
jgi:hypothetical protein